MKSLGCGTETDTRENRERQRFGLVARWGTGLVAVVFLALVTLVFFWKVLLTWDYTLLSHWDGSAQWYPWYRFAAEWVRKGVFPLWDPYVHGGHTFIGEPQAGLFYPFNILQAFLIPSDRALAPADIYWMAAFHGFLAAVFMYALARVLGMGWRAALVAAVVFAFAGFMARRVHIHISIYYGSVWLPLVLALFHLAVKRCQFMLAVGCGLVLGMTALVGSLQPPVYSGMVLAAYACYLGWSAWKRGQGWRAVVVPLALLALAGAFALGVAAIQMLPSMEYEPLALRWSNSPLDPLPGPERRPYWIAGGLFYFHPQSLVSFLMPHAYEPAERSAYLGILSLVLIVVGVAAPRRGGSRFFAVVGLVALVFSFGAVTVVHGLMWVMLPILDKARVAVRSLFVFSFAAALLAGWGMDALLRGGRRAERLAQSIERLGRHALGGLLLLGVALGLLVHYQVVQADLDAYFLLVIMVALSWLALALGRLRRVAPRAWYLVAMAVLLFDVLSYGVGNFALVRDFDDRTNWAPELYYRETGAIRFLRDQPGYFRVENRREAIPPNFGDVWSLFGVGGFGSSIPTDYYTTRSLGWVPPSRLYDMFNIRYIVTTDTIGTLPLVYDGDLAKGDRKVYENPHALPRVWLVHRATQLSPGEATRQRLLAADFDPAQEAVVASPVQLPVAGAGGTASIIEYTLHAIAIQVDTPVDALLVTAENYYPGWRVRVDGQEAEVVRVNAALRGVRVPAGRHAVIFSYEPRSVRWGAAITGVTLALAALAAVGSLALRRLRQRRSREAGGSVTPGLS